MRPRSPIGVGLAAAFALAIVAPLVAQQAAGQQPAAEDPNSDAVFLKGVTLLTAPGVVEPTIIKTVEPKYTSDAMRAKLQGIVKVDVVVAPDGTVARARVAESLDKQFGLDAEAVKAAQQWLFRPGTLNGKAVPVLATVTLQFRIH